jgi:hypothetical protein
LNIEKIMLVNFEVGALEKWIKSKGTDDPHVSHHGVFRRCPDHTSASPMPVPHVATASTCHPCNRPHIAFARHTQELIFPFPSHCRHATACRCLVMPCLALPCCLLGCCTPLHACSVACRPSYPSHQGCCCRRQRLPPLRAAGVVPS